MSEEVVAAALAAAVAAAVGSQLPAVIARLPEPKDAAEDKPLYVDLARARGLGVWCAVIAGLAAGTLGAVLGFDAGLPTWTFLCVIGVGLSFIDWRTKLLPIRVVMPSYAIVAGSLLIAASATSDWDSLIRAAIGWAATFGIFALMWLIYPKGLGYGDVRLSGVLGMALAWQGWPELVIGLYAAFLIGGLVGAVLSALKIVDRKGYPFGPFLLFGAWLAVAITPAIIDWWT
ncbi:MAG TPA: A24 family peptidase [Nocardioidaceae bacterium]|nr:A24 family peptidase [Nocardioidaceae bacterium]